MNPLQLFTRKSSTCVSAGKVTVRALLMESCVLAGPDFGVCSVSGQVSSGFVEFEG